MRIVFLLVEASVPENIGFAMRAMKTMGFNEVRLVNCVDHFSQGTKNTAYGSHDLLERAKTYSSLKAAIKDLDLIVGTSAKKRVGRHDRYDASELREVLIKKEGTLGAVGIVFGSEENGLSNDDLRLCDLISSIPLATNYPSLNLAQAVMIYCYELAKLSFNKTVTSLPVSEQRSVKERSLSLLDQLGVDRHPVLYQRLKDRMMSAGAEDIRLMLSLIKYIDRNE